MNEYKYYEDCTDDEQKIIMQSLCILTNASWVEESFAMKYTYLLGHGRVVDVKKIGGC